MFFLILFYKDVFFDKISVFNYELDMSSCNFLMEQLLKGDLFLVTVLSETILKKVK